MKVPLSASDRVAVGVIFVHGGWVIVMVGYVDERPHHWIDLGKIGFAAPRRRRNRHLSILPSIVLFELRVSTYMYLT